ncbi:hypothetical protein [Francisella sp. SYW-9]|uniref:hypothetical protein n=1 Tax=Francisella sp. SYW-9 TaxID=2610888 RepID=UPI00123C7D42|nr:hypothetical protein [Francisella sp. SYW-9]
MFRDIFETISHILLSLVFAVLLALMLDLIFSGIYSYINGQKGLYALVGDYQANKAYTFNFINYYLDILMHWVGILSDQLATFPLIQLFSDGALVTIIILIQKFIILIQSIYIYIVILLFFIFDGVIFREIRRYRAGPESVRRKEFEGYSTLIETLMINGYLFPTSILLKIFGIDVYLSPAIWFLSLGFIAALFHRLKFVYIQKYL